MGLKAGEKMREGDFIGLINMWAGSSAPTGWLLCDGAAISRTTYSKLFAIVGTSYGVGDGSTTFNVPNLKGRVPVGFDATQTEFDALGESGGAKTHTLTVAEMPAHEHQGAIDRSAGPTARPIMNVLSDNGEAIASYTDNAYPVMSTEGGSAAHQNLQPYLVMNYIIRAAQA